MPTRYRYGVVILTRNRPDLLAQCLQSLTETVAPRPPIFVWDNGSDPESPKICRQYGAKRLHRDGENVSFSAANNEGACQFPGDILLLNNDVFVGPGCVDALIAERRQGCDIVGAKLLYPNGLVQHFGIGFSREMHPFHIGRYQPADSEWVSEARVVPAATGALLLVSRDLWDRLEGLDESFVFGYEDVDFCLRARESGAVVGVTPNAVAVHLESQTEGRSSFDGRNWLVFKRGWLDSGRINSALGVWPVWLTPGVQRIVGPDADMQEALIEA